MIGWIPESSQWLSVERLSLEMELAFGKGRGPSGEGGWRTWPSKSLSFRLFTNSDLPSRAQAACVASPCIWGGLLKYFLQTKRIELGSL